MVKAEVKSAVCLDLNVHRTSLLNKEIKLLSKEKQKNHLDLKLSGLNK